jgi:hypothetical protein
MLPVSGTPRSCLTRAVSCELQDARRRQANLETRVPGQMTNGPARHDQTSVVRRGPRSSLARNHFADYR